MKINKTDCILSDNFINSLERLAAGYLSQESFERLIAVFETEAGKHFFDSSSEANLLRILLNRMDKTSFLYDLIKYSIFVEILIAVSSYSNYLTDILVRNPEFFYTISNPSTLDKELNEHVLEEEIKSITENLNTFKGKVNALKSLKRKEILRIGIKDIILKKDLREITTELSILAKTLSAELFTLCYNEILAKYNIVRNERKFCLVSLGKLGGSELNYSSDIDLILFYDKNSKLKGKEYHEILTETTQLFIDKASAPSGNGFLYRIDFRLRPDGRNSPLCKSLSDYLVYYETRGEDWERQMLIKAGYVCGDIDLYNKFQKYLTPFIYPSIFRSSPLEQIRRMKENIEKNAKSAGDIKLSKGGIRDIEFSLQALQLINGKRFEDLRTGNSLLAIEKLTARNLLSSQEAAAFKEAYVFYRKIEHFLQLLNDAQVHTIPSEGRKLESLATFLGFNSVAKFNKTLQSLQIETAAIYNSITNNDDSVEIEDEPLNKVKTFVNPDKALKNLNFLREGKGILDQKTFDAKAIESFSSIENKLIKYLLNSTEPDLILQNFCHIIKPESFPAIWYEQFRSQKFFTAFLKVLEFSHKTSDLLINDKICKEAFITRRAFVNLDEADLSRISPSHMSFLLSLQFTLGLIEVKEVFALLKKYFDYKIKTATEEVLKKYKGKYFVAALGSFGAGEMSFASDIDLIFISTEKMDNLKSQKAFETLAKQLKELCLPFEIDCRLKPEGQSSPIVWNLENYGVYLGRRAKIWEFQSLTKLRFIAGDIGLFNLFRQTIKQKITELDAALIKKEVYEMRKLSYPKFNQLNDSFNIKKSKGGITDIEFIIQFFLLTNPELFDSCSGKNSGLILEEFPDDKIAPEDKEALLNNFYFLKKLELSLQNIYNTSQLSISKDKFGYQKLAIFMKYESQEALSGLIEKTKNENFVIFEKYLKQV